MPKVPLFLMLAFVSVCSGAGASEFIERERNLQRSVVDATYSRDRVLGPVGSAFREHPRYSTYESDKRIRAILDAYDKAVDGHVENMNLDAIDSVTRTHLALHPEHSYKRFELARHALWKWRREILPNLPEDAPDAKNRYHASTLPLWTVLLSFRYESDPMGVCPRYWTSSPGFYLIERIQANTLLHAPLMPPDPSHRKEWARLLIGYLTHIEELKRYPETVAVYFEEDKGYLQSLKYGENFFPREEKIQGNYRTFQRKHRDLPELYEEIFIKPLVDLRILRRASLIQRFLENPPFIELNDRIIRLIAWGYRSDPDALPELEALLAESSLDDTFQSRIRDLALATDTPIFPTDGEAVPPTDSGEQAVSNAEEERPDSSGNEDLSDRESNDAAKIEQMEEQMREELERMKSNLDPDALRKWTEAKIEEIRARKQSENDATQ